MLSIEYWHATLTILMPILAISLSPTTWSQVHSTLELMLFAMNLALSESGSFHPQKMNNSIPENQEVKPDYEYLTELAKFKGTAWKTFQGIRIEIPTQAWIDYGAGKMNIAMAHNFRQLAWTQLCQFNQEDINEALNNIVFYNKLQDPQFAYFEAAASCKANFINLYYTNKLFTTITSWVDDDKWYDPQLERLCPQIPLDWKLMDQPSPPNNNTWDEQLKENCLCLSLDHQYTVCTKDHLQYPSPTISSDELSSPD